MLRPGQAFKTRLRSKNRTFYARRDQMKTESRNRWRTLQGIIARSLVSARSLGWSKPGPRMEMLLHPAGTASRTRGGFQKQRGKQEARSFLGLELLESECV
jgi:hypothetical protein